MIPADGRRVVFVEMADGSFRAQAVTPLYAVGNFTAISGIPPGTRVVTSGAFFIMSQAAKAGFEEGHAH
jgi:cobalt-zinc-cadmium efflux system membrane fusion protein